MPRAGVILYPLPHSYLSRMLQISLFVTSMSDPNRFKILHRKRQWHDDKCEKKLEEMVMGVFPVLQPPPETRQSHYNDVIMSAMANKNTSLTIVYLTVYSGADQRHDISALLGFLRGIHRCPVNSPHKRPIPRNMFPFEGVIFAVSSLAIWSVL